MICILLLAGSAARACDLALLLAVDVSGSVDAREYEIQMRGLADGLRDPAIAEALVAQQARVAVLQWTGVTRQRISVPWAAINDFDDAADLADRIETAQRIWRNFSTAIGEALLIGSQVFADVPECARRVIDISGDGVSNEGVAPETVKAALAVSDITVNALVIEASVPGLTAYFHRHVIAGSGAFAVTANDFSDYPDRIRQKLLREITKQFANADN